MKRTYIDASVLIAACQGKYPESTRAMKILDDDERSFVISDYLRLEVLPKPMFHGRLEEVGFMETFLAKAAEDVDTSPQLTKRAIEVAGKYDISPVDALHVGAALVSGIDEFVTMERKTSPLCRVMEIKVTSLHSTG